ncbi:hypothetical protein EJ02DRAFT_130850 [Clathrospora elynae]|uniref:Uncharacterized protein n=1 Tax=Clathrospora elynae TaxID=706981 RepID=A0A6A5SUR0_9PLEO|nr:hypothetical protein EJ02DRAFT_130850 [Clathrospora elynae]
MVHTRAADVLTRRHTNTPDCQTAGRGEGGSSSRRSLDYSPSGALHTAPRSPLHLPSWSRRVRPSIFITAYIHLTGLHFCPVSPCVDPTFSRHLGGQHTPSAEQPSLTLIIVRLHMTRAGDVIWSQHQIALQAKR